LYIYEKKVYTVMVINYTNINKANNNLSSLIAEHKKLMTYDVGKPGPGPRQAQQ